MTRTFCCNLWTKYLLTIDFNQSKGRSLNVFYYAVSCFDQVWRRKEKKKKSRFQVESTWLLSITACSSHDRSVDVRYDNVTGNPPQKMTNFFFLKLNYNFASLSFLFLARGKITWSVFFRCSIADGGNVLHHSVDLFNQQKKNKKKVTKNMLWDQESVFY